MPKKAKTGAKAHENGVPKGQTVIRGSLHASGMVGAIATVLGAASAAWWMRSSWFVSQGHDEAWAETSALSTEAAHEQDVAVELLLSHLKSRGALLALRPSTFEAGLRGVAAAVNMEPGSLLATLPLSEVFYNETLASEVQTACGSLPCTKGRVLLALGVAYERARGKSSPFIHFMETLRMEVNNCVAWPWPLLRLMEASMPGTQSFLAMEMRELKGANALLESPVDDSLLIWGLAMVQTRAFGTWNGGEALIPVAGLFNHHWDPSRAVPMPKCDLAARKCHLRTGGRRVAAGEQVFFHYRPWSNLQLLIRYGFAVPGNPWGSDVKLPALAAALEAVPLPSWVGKMGCQGVTLKLRARTRWAAGSEACDGPLPTKTVSCVRAALAANESSNGVLIETMLSTGELEGLERWHAKGDAATARARTALASIASACAQAARRWTEGEGLEALTGAINVGTHLAQAVIEAVKHELELLQECDDHFTRLAETMVTPR